MSSSKSRVYFSPNVNRSDREDLCTCLGLHSTPNLGKYLGFPLKHPSYSNRDFNFVLERVQGKLGGWKAHSLSFAGRVVLTQSVLALIPTYVMQRVMLPRKIIDALDKTSRNFIWGSSVEKRKLHTMSWEKITKPKKEGGLGVTATRPQNVALLAKLNWRVHVEKDQNWAKVLRSKYTNSKRPCFHTWSAIKKGQDVFNKGSKWIVGVNNNLNVWHDKWLSDGPLRNIII